MLKGELGRMWERPADPELKGSALKVLVISFSREFP